MTDRHTEIALRALELMKATTRARGALQKAMQEGDLQKLWALVDATVAKIGQGVSAGRFTETDMMEIEHLMEQGRKLLEGARIGESRPPLRKLDEDDEDSADEDES